MFMEETTQRVRAARRGPLLCRLPRARARASPCHSARTPPPAPLSADTGACCAPIFVAGEPKRVRGAEVAWEVVGHHSTYAAALEYARGEGFASYHGSGGQSCGRLLMRCTEHEGCYEQRGAKLQLKKLSKQARALAGAHARAPAARNATEPVDAVCALRLAPGSGS